VKQLSYSAEWFTVWSFFYQKIMKIIIILPLLIIFVNCDSDLNNDYAGMFTDWKVSSINLKSIKKSVFED